MSRSLPLQPPPCPVWRPDPLPPVGQIRTDGVLYAIHLPLNARDWAPWRVVAEQGQALTHAVVHSAGWWVVTTLDQALTQPPQPPSASPRVFPPGAAQPDDVAAVVTRDGQVWPRSDWHGEHAWLPWSELVTAHGPAVEVPAGELLRVGEGV